MNCILEVYGIIRRSFNLTLRLEHIYIDPHNTTKARMKLHYGYLTDASSLRHWIDEICPDEVYNLAAQSHVGVSFETYDYTADMVATEALSLLEAVRVHIKNTDRKVKHYHAGSSEMFHSCLSEAEIVLYKEFQVMCKELKVISQIAEPVYSASVLENVECGVFDEAAMIDEERDGYLHTLVLNLGDPIQYIFRKGKCKVAKIPLPDKPAILELNP